MAISLAVALQARRLERGEVEALPDLWRAVFGTEIDLDRPVEELVAELGAEITNQIGAPVLEEDPAVEPPVTLTAEQLDAVQELRHVRSEMSDLRRRESDLRKEILQALNSAERGLTASGDPAVKLRKSVRVGVDAKMLEAVYPDVFDEVKKQTEVVTIDLP